MDLESKEPLRIEKDKDITTDNNQERKNDPLAQLLLENNSYESLYKILTDNDIDLEMLMHLNQDETEEFSDNLGFNVAQKLKFRTFMRNISSNLKNTAIMHFDSFMNIVLIGDSGVGKTSLMRRYTNDMFDTSLTTTIGADFNVCKEILTDNTIMKMTIWDTAGQERFFQLTTSYYRTADAIIVCFDVGRDVTLAHCDNWNQQIELYGKDDVIVIFVGCKGDISEISRKSVEEQAQEIMGKYGKLYCECSAKTGENVRNVFLTAAEMVMRQRPKKKTIHPPINLENLDRGKNQPCCIIY